MAMSSKSITKVRMVAVVAKEWGSGGFPPLRAPQELVLLRVMYCSGEPRFMDLL
jgi:hypothetical protein